MGTVGSYPGKMLILDDDGVIFTECYGTMSTESGGFLATLDRVIEDESIRAYIRANFGDSALDEATKEARRLIALRAR